jgi:hypothetical protein
LRPVPGRNAGTWPDERGGCAGLEQSNFRQLMNNNYQQLVVSVVLASQVAFLALFAFAEHVVRYNRWIGAGFGFSFLFGLILSVGFLGAWRQRASDQGLFGFLLASPAELAVAIATVGQIAAILLV